MAIETAVAPAFWPRAEGVPVFPEFSLEERDRRWCRVRELMRAHNVECMIVPPSIAADEQANSRYLSQVGGQQGGAWIIFPESGQVTAIFSSARECNMWQDLQRWITDM